MSSDKKKAIVISDDDNDPVSVINLVSDNSQESTVATKPNKKRKHMDIVDTVDVNKANVPSKKLKLTVGPSGFALQPISSQQLRPQLETKLDLLHESKQTSQTSQKIEQLSQKLPSFMDPYRLSSDIQKSAVTMSCSSGSSVTGSHVNSNANSIRRPDVVASSHTHESTFSVPRRRKKDEMLVEDEITGEISTEDEYKKSIPVPRGEFDPMSSSEFDKFRKTRRKNSKFKRISQRKVDEFMRSPVFKDRDQAIRYLDKTDPEAATIFRLLFDGMTPEQIKEIWAYVQKSTEWLKSRFGCRTGTEGGYLLNWNPYKNVLRFAYEKYWDKFKGNPATEHGTRTEKLAVKIYVNTVQQHLNRWYVHQRSYKSGLFNYRGVIIQLHKRSPEDIYFAPPIYKAWHIGGVRDIFMVCDQISIDLLGTVNNIPFVIGEVKVPWAAELFYLYENERMYYTPQPLDGKRAPKRMWPTIFISDRITFSHKFGMNIDCFIMNPRWYNLWFVPRALRYFFGPQMTMCVEYIVKLFAYKHPKRKYNLQTLREFMNIEFFVPSMVNKPKTNSSILPPLDDGNDTHDNNNLIDVDDIQLHAPETLPDVMPDVMPDMLPPPPISGNKTKSDEFETDDQFVQAKQFDERCGIFPRPQLVAKKPGEYFSDARMVDWRSKAIMLDLILRHELHSVYIPSFYMLINDNQHQGIWQDDVSHFGRTFPFDEEKENELLVSSQDDYIEMFESEDYDGVLDALDHELNLKCDFNWCVFVAGMKIKTPTPTPDSYTISSLRDIHLNSTKKSRKKRFSDFDNPTMITVRSLEMNQRFTTLKPK